MFIIKIPHIYLFFRMDTCNFAKRKGAQERQREAGLFQDNFQLLFPFLYLVAILTDRSRVTTRPLLIYLELIKSQRIKWGSMGWDSF